MTPCNKDRRIGVESNNYILCRAREETAQWKDRQNQITKEELRLQSSLTNVRKKDGATPPGKETGKVRRVFMLGWRGRKGSLKVNSVGIQKRLDNATRLTERI